MVIRSSQCGVRSDDVRGECRRREVVLARAWIAAELRADYGLSYPAIGRVLGGRHHTTIMNLLGRVSR